MQACQLTRTGNFQDLIHCQYIHMVLMIFFPDLMFVFAWTSVYLKAQVQVAVHGNECLGLSDEILFCTLGNDHSGTTLRRRFKETLGNAPLEREVRQILQLHGNDIMCGYMCCFRDKCKHMHPFLLCTVCMIDFCYFDTQ